MSIVGWLIELLKALFSLQWLPHEILVFRNTPKHYIWRECDHVDELNQEHSPQISCSLHYIPYHSSVLLLFVVSQETLCSETDWCKHCHIRLACSEQLLKKCSSSYISFMWFAGVKLFAVSTPKNSQIDWLHTSAAKKDKEHNSTQMLSVSISHFD